MEKRVVKRTERGWPGHFCNASRCNFHRNTLLQCGGIRIVVSTIGLYQPEGSKDYVFLGAGARMYETMCFHARRKQKIYWDADVCRQIYPNGPTAIDVIDDCSDHLANEMHEKIVKKLTRKLELGTLKEKGS